jgi:hypothetical protein
MGITFGHEAMPWADSPFSLKQGIGKGRRKEHTEDETGMDR